MTIERNAILAFLLAFVLGSMLLAGAAFAQTYDPDTGSNPTGGTDSSNPGTTGNTETTGGTDTGTTGGTGTNNAGGVTTDENSTSTPGLPNTGGGAAARG